MVKSVGVKSIIYECTFLSQLSEDRSRHQGPMSFCILTPSVTPISAYLGTRIVTPQGGFAGLGDGQGTPGDVEGGTPAGAAPDGGLGYGSPALVGRQELDSLAPHRPQHLEHEY